MGYGPDSWRNREAGLKVTAEFSRTGKRVEEAAVKKKEEKTAA